MLKKCNVCGLEKDISEFGIRRDSKDGHKHRCMICDKRKAKEYRDSHRDVENLRQAKYRKNNPGRVRESRRAWREKNPDARKKEYDRHLKKLGKERRRVLSEEEKAARYEIQKEKNRVKNKERYKANFVSVEKHCKYCGKPFMTQYKKSKVFCSEECVRKNAHYQSKIAEKRRNGKITERTSLDTDITLPLLYKRDKGICKICGGLCDWSDISHEDGYAIVGNMYPSIDHIKPVSKGGSHTWDNVQLAHKQCNSIKNDKETF